MSKKQAPKAVDKQPGQDPLIDGSETQELDLDLSEEPEAVGDTMDAEDTQVLDAEMTDDARDVDDGKAKSSVEEDTLTVEGEVLEGQLSEELAAARLEADDYRDRYLRTQAEMDNERRKNQRELEKAHKFALDKIAGELLSVRDNLERGLEAAQAEGSTVELICEGTEMTLKSLTHVMEKFNITAINPMGEKFDPDLHQAISMQPTEDAESGTVTMVIQQGYTLNERLLRPAMVVVAQ